jgi:Cys-rich repeat protein
MKTTTSLGFVLSAVLAVGCTNGPTLARPNTQSVKAQARDALGGIGLAATATFDAPVVDANSTGNPTAGTGTFTLAPSTTGGNASLGVVDNSARPSLHYVMVGDLMGTPTTFFAVIADVPFTAGAHAIDNVHYFAGFFDAQTGDPTHLATSGAVTFTTAGGIGGRWVGSFNGVVEAVQATPGCQSTADCAAGEVCSNGTCVRAPPPQCTSSAQCAAGNVCQAGVCVPVSQPACVADSDCAANQICAGGQCVTLTPPPVCQSSADCARGEQCQGGACVPVTPPQCTSSAQCPGGWVCQAGQCTPGSNPTCSGQQGDGSLSGSVTTVASCAAIPAGNVSITQGFAVIDDQLRLVIFDANTGNEGAMLELSVCPGATGTLTIGNGLVTAAHIKDVQTADLRIYAERKASSASLTLTRISPSLAGSFALTLSSGGAVNGTFTMQ